MRRRIAGFVVTIQLLLFFGHWLVYETWMYFSMPGTLQEARALQIALGVLSITFVTASMLSFRFNNPPVRWFYTLSATWIGTLNYLVLAASGCWIVYGAELLLKMQPNRPEIGDWLFAAGILVSVFGIANAWWVRVRRVGVKLQGLPEAWRGRTAALVTDLHLGHVRGTGFLRRVIKLIRNQKPDIVFIAGDLYDGGKADAGALVAPWNAFSAPFGTYFVTGNHEGFTNPRKYIEAVKGAGIRALENELVDVDGLQILGVNYSDSRTAEQLQGILDRAGVDPSRASVMLLHVPHGMAITENHGVSLQLSGHTHGGQMFPFTWFTRRVFGGYTYGLSRFGEMQVFTSCGAGTWGPPMRVGTTPEIVLIRFE
ncbi:MAG TPA: metallophosphoesterase [Candidatus Acidoferrum sp.]|nr:metallophosphoesterase [Candidatus Acidoferrum sp.]